ncbi:hypothetical protein [uncultured Salegentibacter sp.]|uniref:hypothetical protein n=1 Tax=uncultured Salegentibacter sp. TaxID=259320 RepID=UPI002595BCBB|nr:hypothetical protein [uncultured Salegentibacter sp.]
MSYSIKELADLNPREFILHYETTFIHEVFLASLDENHKAVKSGLLEFEQKAWEMDYEKLEINFIHSLSRYIVKKDRVLKKYNRHTFKNKKYATYDKPERIKKVWGNWWNGNQKPKFIFLHKRMKELGVFVKLETLFDQNEEGNKKDNNDPVDLSGTIGTEKIIFLQELGILDKLRATEPFQSSTMALATAISALTGINATTVQSYLNPIVNSQAKQTNNPLKSNMKVEKVKQTLINLGYKVN